MNMRIAYKFNEHIPNKLYKKIYVLIPIVCVDLVVIDGKGRFLLLKRRNNPERGKWWFPGGRVLKNERLKTAALRKLNQEIGVSGRVKKLLGVHEYFSPKGYFPNISAHNIAFVFLVKTKEAKPTMDTQSSKWRWFSKIESKFNPYIKRYLKLAGFR